MRTLLQDHDVYITDWHNARDVSLRHGAFGLDDYIDYIREFIRHIGAERLHVISVCQPTVPVLAAVSLMASDGFHPGAGAYAAWAEQLALRVEAGDGQA